MTGKIKIKKDEHEIYGGVAVIYKRNEYFHYRQWIAKENKYVRRTLKTKNKDTAIERGEKLAREILNDLDEGRKVFSITVKQGVEEYIEHRQKDVEGKFIVAGRLTTIKTHLTHFLNYIHKDTKLREIDRRDAMQYFNWRRKGNRSIKSVTLSNEQSTINSFWKYCFEEQLVNFESLVFAKIKVNSDVEQIRRSTFTNDEYRKLTNEMRSYCSKKSNDDEDELRIKKIVQHYILIAANTGLRVGEQRQLKWKDVEIVRTKNKGEDIKLAKVTVRRETSKVRNSRVFIARNGQYFERLKELSKYVGGNCYVFSDDEEKMLTKRTLYYHFNKLKDLIGIDKDRNVTLYSLRHFFITQRIMSGVSFRELSSMCGTSMTQIEKTYYHLNEMIMKTTALKDYKLDDDGKIIQI
jgi:site-specific recombinase XerD